MSQTQALQTICSLFVDSERTRAITTDLLKRADGKSSLWLMCLLLGAVAREYISNLIVTSSIEH